MDSEGRLERLFEGPLGNDTGEIAPPPKGRKKGSKAGGDEMVKPLTPEEVVIIEEQEGWILGVT